MARRDVRALYGSRSSNINATLAQFERIKKFRSCRASSRSDAGELTPTLKVKRRVIEERYRAVIEEMYRES